MKQIITPLAVSLSILLAPGRGIADTGKGSIFPEIPHWKLSIGETVYTPGNLWDIIDGAADSYLSYDFEDLHLADYSRGGVIVHVELYRHGSQENAFGIYSSERSPDYRFINLGTEGYTGQGILNFLSGIYYVKIYSTSGETHLQESLLQIAREVERALDQDRKWPVELDFFPAPGKLPRTERYIARDFLGFDFLHSAFTASYYHGEEFQLFLIHGKEPGEIKDMLEKYIAFTGQQVDLAAEGSFVIRDPYNGDILVGVRGNRLCGVLGCSDPGLRENYLGLLLDKLGQ